MCFELFFKRFLKIHIVFSDKISYYPFSLQSLYIEAIIIKQDRRYSDPKHNYFEHLTYFWEVDLPLCDVWKQKTQILIAHQKEDIERTQKSTATRQKKFG